MPFRAASLFHLALAAKEHDYGGVNRTRGYPAFEGTDEQRCAYQRLARKWRWLASGGASQTELEASV